MPIHTATWRDQVANIRWIIDKARGLQKKKKIYLCFINYTKVFACVDYNKLWRALKEMRVPHNLTCFLTNLYAVKEATVRTLHGTTDWFKLEKRVRQGCWLSPCLFNWYAQHIMRNAGLDEVQAGIKIGRRNINNLWYVDDTSWRNPTSKEWWLHGHRRAERSYSMFRDRRGGSEEIPLVQGKEQWLRCAGAAVNTYPTSNIRETKKDGRCC